MRAQFGTRVALLKLVAVSSRPALASAFSRSSVFVTDERFFVRVAAELGIDGGRWKAC
jgi:hypothetical protein